MTLFKKAANSLYIRILGNGPFVPQTLITEIVSESREQISQRFTQKELLEFSDTERDKVDFYHCHLNSDDIGEYELCS